MNQLGEIFMLTTLLVLGQVSSTPHDWTNLASLPFAFAVGAFLIWSMVQLINIILKQYNLTTSDTINTLRMQLTEVRQFENNTLVSLLTSTTKVIERSADVASETAESWKQVHEDVRDLVSEIRLRPCLTTPNQKNAKA